VRFAIALLGALALVASAGCGGGEDAAPDEPVPLEQRVVSAEDAPGSKPDPVETGSMTVEFDEFIDFLGEVAVDPDTEEMTDVFREAGFEGAITDTRFFGATHSPDAPHVNSSAIQLQSDEGAASALEWLEDDSMKPCPTTCAVKIGEFDVDGVPDAWGVRRSASAEDIEAVGTPDDRPFESYGIGFTDGSFVYTLDLHGPPGSVSEERASNIARTLYERISDLPS
jgi:hypothetical protein